MFSFMFKYIEEGMYVSWFKLYIPILLGMYRGSSFPKQFPSKQFYRFQTLGIMRVQFYGPLKPLGAILPWCSKSFRGVLNSTLMMHRDVISRSGARLIGTDFACCVAWSSCILMIGGNMGALWRFQEPFCYLYTNQAYHRPRCWRFSASLGSFKGSLLTPPVLSHNVILRGLRGDLNEALIMPMRWVSWTSDE